MTTAPETPPKRRIWPLRLWSLLYATWNVASERHVGLISAGVAFFGIFAIFPAISAVIAIFGLVADPVIVLEQIALMEDIIPQEAYALLVGQMGRLLAAGTGTLGWATFVSIALALWASRAGVAALMGGLNAIADRPPRNGFKQVIVALTLTICLVALAITAMMAVIIAPIVIAFAPIGAGSALILEAVRWLVAFCVLYAALALLYRFGPNQRGARIRWFTIGAATAIALWIAASAGLSYYLTNFASYNEVYGSLGAVIGMLLWLYITSYLILLGAALNLQVHGRIDGEAR
ncbi:YihY/virulence factor BrkB family protein [Yoonia sp. R2331]|uniref:YihY/virulence factor BrkB family protein n=1 Tax=Yoonia sp. R2331 TaxID=3237238 RepID=UPI0034E511E0